MSGSLLVGDAATILVDTATQGMPTGQRSALLPDGRIVVAWQETTGLNGDGSGSAIKAKVLNADGSTAIGEFLVNSTVLGDQTAPSVSALMNGQFVIAWTDGSQAGTSQGLDIRAQVFTAGGFRQGGELLVNTTTAGDQTGAQVAGLTGGGFAVAWNGDKTAFTVFGANRDRVFAERDYTGFPDANTGGRVIGIESDLNGGFRIFNYIESGSLGYLVTGSGRNPDIRLVTYFKYYYFTTNVTSGNVVSGFGDFAGTRYEYAETRVSTLGKIATTDAGNTALEYYAGTIQLASAIQLYSSPLPGISTDTVTSLAIEKLQGNDFALAYVNRTGLHVGVIIAGVYSEASYAGGNMPVIASEIDMVVGSNGRIFVSWTNAAGSIDGQFFTYGGPLAARQEGSAGDDVLIGTAGADLLRGFQGNDLLLGLDGADLLYGHDGNDTLDGGAGADTMEGGAGNDQYLVDNPGDIVIEAADAGTDTAWVSFDGWTVAANVEITRLYGAGMQVRGNAGADIIVANAGAASNIAGGDGDDTLWGSGLANTLDGAAGDDIIRGQDGAARMIGGAGNDQFVVGNLGVVIVENAGEGIDTAWVGVDGWTNFANVEIVRLAAPGAVTLLGSEGNEDLVANQAAASRIDGNGGNDTLWGSPFADTLSGGAGDDIMRGQGGADIMAGGTGNDQYVVFDRNATVIENLNEGYDIVYFAGTGSFFIGNNVEEARLVASGTGLVGNALDNLMAGNSSGLASTLDGGAGNDIMFGTAVADRFIGGAGNDTMYTQGGADVFAYRAAGWGYDRIAGWTPGACKLQFEAASGVTSFAQLSVIAANGNTQVDYAGSTIVVFGVALTQSDFLFA